MGKSKHRKNHTSKLKQFKQNQIDITNKIRKQSESYVNQMQEYQERAKKEYVIETVYMNDNSLVEVNSDGIWNLNMNSVEEKGGILYWKKSKNPLLSGLESIDNYSVYTITLVNELLKSIQQRLAYKAQKEVQQTQLESTMGIETHPVSEADFTDVTEIDLVEDPTFKSI